MVREIAFNESRDRLHPSTFFMNRIKIQNRPLRFNSRPWDRLLWHDCRS